MYGGSHCRWLKRGSARLRLYSKSLSGQRVQSGTWPEVLESPGETRVCKEEQLRPPPRQEKAEECRQEQSGDIVQDSEKKQETLRDYILSSSLEI